MSESTPISEERAEEIYRELSKIKLARPVIQVFRREADVSILRHTLEGYIKDPDYLKDNKICAKIKNPDLYFITMVLRELDKKSVSLDFYSGEVENILKYGKSDFICTGFAYIYAGARRTGIWAAGYGSQFKHEISVHIREDIALPSKAGRWFFDLMNWLAIMSSEELDVSEQERFWAGDKENCP